ncbi:DUF47 domain-containing protein [Arabiibacter massiliensis]|uniref:DUF47 domain-containing protein n=1 Tax=Arabiibacter massiliensis TaxID=1870985 RepID=UPI0009BB26F2|nr:DUF47 family protein [Arabiibacter massiliensis]
MGKKKREKADYFDLFEKQAEAAVAEAQLLVEVIDEYESRERVRELMERAHKLENESDEHNHLLYKRMAHDFITPIERDDIIELAQGLDNLIDYIEDVVLCFYMYRVNDMHEHAREFARLIKKSCKALEKAMGDFRNFKKSKTFNQLVIDVNAYEEEADRLYMKVNRSLYDEGNGEDALHVLRWSQIFDRMEKCCDACEHAADTMSGILLKNV